YRKRTYTKELNLFPGKREVRLEINDQTDSPIADVAEKLVELENAPKEEKESYIKELKENDALGHNRIRVVKNRDGEAEIKLSDSKGNPRIRLVVDADDVPKFEFLIRKVKSSTVFHRKYCLVQQTGAVVE